MKHWQMVGGWGAAAVIALATTPALAQSADIAPRVGKLEKEMRAVQRKVFPQGAPVEPDLSSPSVPTVAPGAAASTPVADLTARVDGLEKQLAALTGSSEQSSFRVRQLEEALARVQSRLNALEGNGSLGGASGSASSEPAAVTPTSRPATRSTAATPAAVTTTRPAATPTRTATAKPDPARTAAIAAVEMPSTGDAVEDEYTYGFRLYSAKLYPEAQARLKAFVLAQPVTQRRWSYASNLLGRAYLDGGKPALAAVTFYDNYQKAPRGERAAESLTSLGEVLVKLKKLPDACKVYGVLTEDYGTKLTADQRARAARGRADAKCPA